MPATPPPRLPGRRKSSSPPTVAIALIAALVLGAGLLGMAAAVLPGMALMLLVGFGLILFFIAQYFLWAKWMHQYLMRKEQEAAMTGSSSKEPSPNDGNH